MLSKEILKTFRDRSMEPVCNYWEMGNVPISHRLEIIQLNLAILEGPSSRYHPNWGAFQIQ